MNTLDDRLCAAQIHLSLSPSGIMRIHLLTATLFAALLPSVATAQDATTAAPVALAKSDSAPVANAFREYYKDVSKHLMAAGDEMPARKYSYKPTKAQMSFGQIMVHLAQGNDYLCGAIGGMKAPERSKVAPTDSKAVLVARLKETFEFCDQALAQVDDSKLNEQMPFFGGRMMSRAAVMTITIGDWADHYSQEAIYLRLNGLLPPTAKKPAM
jgi:uncharacterized damage-inducible protein DinB